MLLRLLLPALGGVDYEQACVDRTHPGQHVLDKAAMTGHVHERNLRALMARRLPRTQGRSSSPRAFSSGQRSGSSPVRAFTSVDLPWSTCPAVATTLMAQESLARIASWPSSTVRRSQTVRPQWTRATTGGRAPAQAIGPIAIDRHANGGDRDSGQRPPAHDRPALHHLAHVEPLPAAAGPDSGASAMRHSGTVSLDVPSQVGKGHVLQGARARALPGRRARASGWRGQRSTRSRVTGDHARLGAAEKLVAGEGDERRARREGLVGGRLPDQPRRGATGQPRASLRRKGPTRGRRRPGARGGPVRRRRRTR